MSERTPGYLQLLRLPHIMPVLAAVTIGRLAAGMVPFGMIAVFVERHELAWAGGASAAFLVGAAVAGPYKGRLVDRVGAARLIIPMAVTFFFAASAGGILAAQGQRLAALVLITASAVLAPPNSAILRSVWTAIARDDQENARLHSLDSVVEESTFVITPLLTSGIWLTVGSKWAVVAGATCALLGTIWFKLSAHALGAETPVMAGHRRDPDQLSETGGEDSRSVLSSRNGMAVLVPMLGLGVAMGALSVGYPAWALERSTAEFSGVLMALGSIGGILGALLYGRLRAGGNPWRRYFAVAALQAAAVALVGLSPNIPVAVVVSVVAGMALTPMYVIAFVLVKEAFASPRHTEVNAAIGSAYNLGSGVAAVLAGAAITKVGLVPTLMLVGVIVAALASTALCGRAMGSTPTQHLDGTAAPLREAG